MKNKKNNLNGLIMVLLLVLLGFGELIFYAFIAYLIFK